MIKGKLVVKDNPNMMVDAEKCPFAPSWIPNMLGINLCSVRDITWEKQDDGQLVNITINFIPNNGDKNE